VSLADEAMPSPSTKVQLGKLAELLERSGVDLDTVARVKTVKAWQGFMKGDDGEPRVIDLHGIEFVPTFADGPQWPVIQPGPTIKLPAAPRQARPLVGFRTCVIGPDIQFGYYHGANGELVPIHDEAALSIFLAYVADTQPDEIVLVGDNLDLAEFGKYRLTPAFQGTTQATIDRATRFCAELRARAPRARIRWIAGNHEERLPNFILDNAAAAFGIKVGETPDSWPVMSVPFLCQFDRYSIEYLPGYPASKVWINDRLRVIHGHKVKSSGSTAHAYLATEKTSVIFGHIHRREYAARSREDHDGVKEIMAASPGCLCRVDGVVPSTKGGMDLEGRPVPTTEDWQQGFAVVRYEPGDGRFTYTNVAIHDGWAMVDGREYTA
jgi:metallophosphoesterase superfamily enzyme